MIRCQKCGSTNTVTKNVDIFDGSMKELEPLENYITIGCKDCEQISEIKIVYTFDYLEEVV